jgi:hypothetical protein
VDVNRITSILLQTFLTVAEAGQISEAARRLHLSQPAVTGHIRRLEANLETWALASGELGGLAGQFYQFANSIRSELSAVTANA